MEIAAIFFMMTRVVNSLISLKDKDYLNDFTILVGSKEYRCNKLIACIFSPYIEKSLDLDPTTNNFYIDIEDQDDNFSTIIDCMYMKPFDKKKMNPEIIEMLNQLGCFDYLDELINSRNYELDDLDDLKVCASNLLHRKSRNQEFSKEVDFLASSFYLLDSDVIDCLDLEAIDAIVSSPSLVCEDEHSLLEFILNIIKEQGKEYHCLLEHIVFGNLSDEDLKRCSEEFHDIELNLGLYQALISYDTSMINHEMRYHNFVDEIGIFHRLRRIARRNPASAGLVSVLASSINDDLYDDLSSSRSEVVLDYFGDKGWYSKNQANQWIMFDLRDFKAKVSHYEIRFGKDTDILKQSWCFESSDDGEIWHILHKKNSHNDPFSTHKYRVKSFKYHRYFRVRQVIKGWGTKSYQNLTHFELYGIISK